MRLYHYSFKQFDKFEINKNNLNCNIDSLQEGLGIYLSSSKHKFKQYGNILYTVETAGVYDFTNVEKIYKIIKTFLLRNYTDDRRIILNNLNEAFVHEYVEGVKTGHYSISNLIKNIWDCIEEKIYSLPKMYDSFGYELNLLDYQENLNKKWEIFLKLKTIKYYDNNFKINVFIAKESNILKIIKSEVI